MVPVPARHPRALGLAAALCVGAPLAARPASAPPQVGAEPDEVRVEDRTYTGRVVFQDDERVVLRTGSREREFDRSKITSLRSVRESMRLLLLYLRDASPYDVEVLLELAAFADARGLPGAARLLWLRVLLRDPENEEANLALGNRQRRGRWELEHEGGWWTMRDLERRTRDWNDSWELRTLHFHVRANVDLGEAIDLAFDLEHLYYAYYEFLSPGLDLRETTEPMQVQVHSDLGSFPETSGERRSYFLADQNTAYLNFSSGVRRSTGLHEAVHLLTHNTSRSRRSAGDLPAWIDEGLAEYLQAACHGAPGRMRVDLGRLLISHFHTHHGSRHPYSLSRLTRLSTADFSSSSNQELKYAQSYTLVDFLLHGDDGAWREPFLEFVAWCYEGRSSETHFRAKLGANEEALERAWKAHVERTAVGGRDDPRPIR